MKAAILAVVVLIVAAGAWLVQRRAVETVAAVTARLRERGVQVTEPRFDWSGASVDAVAIEKPFATMRAEGIRVASADVLRAVARGKPLEVRVTRVAVDASKDGVKEFVKEWRSDAADDKSDDGRSLPEVGVQIDQLVVQLDGEPVHEPRPATLRYADKTLSGSVALADGLELTGTLGRKGGEWTGSARLAATRAQQLEKKGVTLDMTPESRIELSATNPNGRGQPFALEARVVATGVAHAAFSLEPWLVTDAQVRVEGTYDREKQALATDASVRWGDLVGTAHVEAAGPWEKSRLKASVDVKATPCTALNDIVARRGSVEAASGNLRLAAEVKADGERLAEFEWKTREKAFDCKFALRQEAFGKDFLMGAFELVRDYGEGRQAVTPVAASRGLQITEALRLAFQASEDTGFPWHRGVDPAAIEGAMRLNFQAGGLHSGASTITMQLARTLFLVPQRTVMRKIEEAMIALYLEQVLDKTRILELYLSIVPFGPEVFGVKRASQLFFQKDYDTLSLAEAAALAQLLPSPARRARSLCSRGRLGVPPERVPGLLTFMFEHGWITQDVLDEEMARVVEFRPRAEDCARFPQDRTVRRLEQRKT